MRAQLVSSLERAIEDYVSRAVGAAPSLTQSQRDRLSVALRVSNESLKRDARTPHASRLAVNVRR
jgi:hypothetical protein